MKKLILVLAILSISFQIQAQQIWNISSGFSNNIKGSKAEEYNIKGSKVEETYNNGNFVIIGIEDDDDDTRGIPMKMASSNAVYSIEEEADAITNPVSRNNTTTQQRTNPTEDEEELKEKKGIEDDDDDTHEGEPVVEGTTPDDEGEDTTTDSAGRNNTTTQQRTNPKDKEEEVNTDALETGIEDDDDDTHEGEPEVESSGVVIDNQGDGEGVETNAKSAGIEDDDTDSTTFPTMALLPNPTNGASTVYNINETNGMRGFVAEGVYKIEVLNSYGLLKMTVVNSNIVDLTKLKNGTYFVNIYMKGSKPISIVLIKQ